MIMSNLDKITLHQMRKSLIMSYVTWIKKNVKAETDKTCLELQNLQANRPHWASGLVLSCLDVVKTVKCPRNEI